MTPPHDPGVDYEADRKPRFPRWVKIAALILVVVALLLVALNLLGLGGHGPRRHFSSPATTVTPHVAPPGIHE